MEIIKLKTQLYIYNCKQCHYSFKYPVYPYSDYSYGEFLLKGSNGEAMYLSAVGDQPFSELEYLIDSNLRVASMSDADKLRVFRKILGCVYDKDSAGNQFYLEGCPACPVCGSVEDKCFEETQPPEYVFVNAMLASSNDWSALDAMGKRQVVDGAIVQALSSL